MITVVGVDRRPLSEPARTALAQARWVTGWPRHLDAVGDAVGAQAEVAVIDRDLPRVLDALDAAPRPAVVLASGDPGYFGVVRPLRERHGPVEVVPALSSVAAAFAAAGLPWDDAHVVSCHGREPHRAVAACRARPKVAVLTEPKFTPADLGAALSGLDRRLIVCERLGESDERVQTVTAEEAAAADDWRDPNVVLVLAPDAEVGERGWAAPRRVTAPGWALPDDAFAHRDGQLTKAEVRAQALAWLGPGLGDLVWDVGCGAGSVAVECARLGAGVIGVDRDADQVARARANAAAHDVTVEVRRGEAPAALDGLADPDAVFVGGGGTAAPAIAAAAAARARRVVVVALAAVERVGPVWAALAAAGCDVDGVQLAASRLTALPGGDGDDGDVPAHRLAALNPVMLVRGVRR